VLFTDSSVHSTVFAESRVTTSLPTATTAISPSASGTGVSTRELAARAALLLPLLAGALSLVAAMHAIEPLPIGVFYDDAQYVILAKSLATGHGYRFLNLPGMPAATHFPPGYPSFLALLWRIAPAFPENVAIFKFANAVLLAIVAVATVRLGERTLRFSRPLAFAAGVAGTATIPSLVLASAVMSEPLFLALLLPFLVWAEHLTSKDSATLTRARLRDAVLAGLAGGAIMLVRTHGMAAVAGLVGGYLLRGRRREALVSAAASIVVVAPWLAWVGLHGDVLPPLLRGAYGSYTDWFVTGLRDKGLHLLALTIPDNIATLGTTTVRSLVPAGHPALDVFAGITYALIAALGIGVCWRRARVLTLFVAGYFAIVVVWPFSPLRFLWAVWPVTMLIVAAGVARAWDLSLVRRSAVARRTAIGVAAVLALAMVIFNLQGYVNAWWSSNARYHARRVLPQLAWVERSTAPSDLIGSDAEAAVYLYTGRRSIPLTSFTAAEYVRERTMAEESAIVTELVNRYQPRYLLVTSPQLERAVGAVAAAHPKVLTRIDSLPKGAIFERRGCMRLAGQMAPIRCE
jgi:hypothetical protein